MELITLVYCPRWYLVHGNGDVWFLCWYGGLRKSCAGVGWRLWWCRLKIPRRFLVWRMALRWFNWEIQFALRWKILYKCGYDHSWDVGGKEDLGYLRWRISYLCCLVSMFRLGWGILVSLLNSTCFHYSQVFQDRLVRCRMVYGMLDFHEPLYSVITYPPLWGQGLFSIKLCQGWISIRMFQDV